MHYFNSIITIILFKNILNSILDISIAQLIIKFCAIYKNKWLCNETLRSNVSVKTAVSVSCQFSQVVQYLIKCRPSKRIPSRAER